MPASPPFDVIVIGGGHAGCEAAAAAARAGARTALVTHKRNTIGAMSCNPAIGGLGKGHLVREVDALDGVMGRCADASGIQFRLLNRSKGPAVQGPRAQIDRALYAKAMQAAIAAQPSLSVVEGGADDVLVEDGRIAGCRLSDGSELRAAAVILATGTFLDGVIHLGDERTPAGRWGEGPALGLSERLYGLGLPMGRLKTGTPPRLDGRTINWDALEMQPADDEPVPFSTLTDRITVPQIACGITWTNAAIHDRIARRIDQSAVYSGAIKGAGPRYCPSIEDKVHRFPDRTRHQVFLEPEGLDDPTVYPNGISTSLPRDLQQEIVAGLAGCADAVILQHGYAIEYDYCDPRALSRSLECQALPGLFLAGQINGTTGYEEAAAQGLLAGVNAARLALGHVDGPVTVGRDEGYLGVMVDDLVTRGVTEPYRMFTSRAEYRLSLRADNADRRLTPLGLAWGVVSEARAEAFHVKTDAVERAAECLAALDLTSSEARARGWRVSDDGRRRTAAEYLAFPDLDWADLEAVWPELAEVPRAARDAVSVDALYSGYLARQAADIAALKKDEALRLPPGLDYREVGGLTTEAREKLEAARPETLGQASRIEGVTPGALIALLGHVSKPAQKAKAAHKERRPRRAVGA